MTTAAVAAASGRRSLILKAGGQRPPLHLMIEPNQSNAINARHIPVFFLRGEWLCCAKDRAQVRIGQGGEFSSGLPQKFQPSCGAFTAKALCPGRQFASALRKAGVRFLSNAATLPGKPDMALKLRRLAVFVDGDFWHGHQWKLRGLQSLDSQLAGVNNKKYWLEKISRNVKRDFTNTALLLDSGWSVLRVWESAVRQNLEGCVQMTIDSAERRSRQRRTGAFSELSRLTVGNSLRVLDWSGSLSNGRDGASFLPTRSTPGSLGCTKRISEKNIFC